jgi:C4-type Zn-finger protein
MTEQIEMAIDVATRTTRGRTCPRCGGKIIPSIRSVYQSPGDPNGVFAAWQCERCSYEEVLSRPAAPAGRETPAKPTAKVIASTPLAAPAASMTTATAAPPMQDVKGRDLPADVRVMISQMNKAQSKLPTN